MKKSNRLKVLGVDGRIILKWIFKMGSWGGGVLWTDLPQDKEQQRTSVGFHTI